MLIFLDIDGVMNITPSWSKPNILSDNFTDFSQKSILALNQIIKFSSASVVLTTSHRYSFSLNEWKLIFKNRGINLNLIDRLPHNTNYISRKQEIENYLICNNIKNNYIIIDDDKSLNGMPEEIKQRCIITSPLIGLTEIDVVKLLFK